MTVRRFVDHWKYNTRRLVIMVLSPLAEKNPVKALAIDAPMTLSFKRVALAAITAAAVRQVFKVGFAGWPEVTFLAVLVIVFVFLDAFSKASSEQAIGVLGRLVDRFGVGQGRVGDAESVKAFHEAFDPDVVKRRQQGDGTTEPTP